MAIPGLDICTSYWVTITAASYCGRSITTEPMMLDIKDSVPYVLEVILPKDTLCNEWINQDRDIKITDMEEALVRAGTSCSLVIPCFNGSEWQCTEDDDKKLMFK